MCKILICCMIFLVLLVGCGNSNQGKTPTQTTNAESTPAVESGCSLPNQEFSPSITPDLDRVGSLCRSLEEVCASATDVLEAVFVGQIKVGESYTVYQFNVTKNIRGSGTEEKINVHPILIDYYVAETDIDYSTNDCQYEEGKTYLLLLTRTKSEAESETFFFFSEGSLVIPIDSSESVLHHSHMYGENLQSYIESESLLRAFEDGTYRERILELTKNNPMFSKQLYTDDATMETVIDQANYVFDVSLRRAIIFSDTIIVYVAVLNDTYKGEISSETVLLAFPYYDVENVMENGIITATMVDSPSNMFLVYDNSIFDVSERDAIIALIEEEK